MALNGINLALAFTGQELAAQRAFSRFNLTEQVCTRSMPLPGKQQSRLSACWWAGHGKLVLRASLPSLAAHGQSAGLHGAAAAVLDGAASRCWLLD